MRKMQQVHATSIRMLVLLALMAAAPGLVFSQGGSVELPENARAKSYGSGWECERGYREDNGACIAVIVAENAHLDSSGNDWECNRSYRKKQGKCALP